MLKTVPHKMLTILPDYKILILKSIESSLTNDHLTVCRDFIELFKLRYGQWIDPVEFYMHVYDLDQALQRKTDQILN